MNLHSVLALTDLSAEGNRAVVRAAMLAEQQRCLLKIMYAPPGLQGAIDAEVAQDMKRLASEIYTRFDILVKNVADTGGDFETVAEEARWADLLVIGEYRKRSGKSFFCGPPVERLQRSISCPVLVARLEAMHRYQRILVAIDTAPHGRKLLQVARSLDVDAEIKPFHASATGFGSRLRAAGGRDLAWDTEDRRMHSTAELIVVGKRRRCGMFDFLFGSGANRVLRRSTGDVLWVPHDLRIEPQPGPVMAPSA